VAFTTFARLVPARFQNGFQVFEYLRGLLRDARRDHLLRRRVQGYLSSCEHKAPHADALRVRPDWPLEPGWWQWLLCSCLDCNGRSPGLGSNAQRHTASKPPVDGQPTSQ